MKLQSLRIKSLRDNKNVGRLNTKGDWQQDPCAMLKVTVGCQMEILMVVEALILKEFEVVSINTDGFDAIVPVEREVEFFQLCKEYEERIGNSEMGNFEFTEFAWIAQTSVNDYCAKKLGTATYEESKVVFKEDTIVQPGSSFPHLKLKGDFTIDFELHKNSSFRIKPLALVNYFDRGIRPEEVILTHDDIFDFCARSNSGKTYFHEAYQNNKVISGIPKLIRYYVAKEGMYIKKIVKATIDTNANNQEVQPAGFLKKICNRLPPSDYEAHLQNVNRNWYIDSVLSIIYQIENGKPPKRGGSHNPNQISMF